jgi:hypothetical protein
MDDIASLRDHSQPCEHDNQRKFRSTVNDLWMCSEPGCPGGREVVAERFAGGGGGERWMTPKT